MRLSVGSATFAGMSRMTSSSTCGAPASGRLKPLRSCVVTGPYFGAGPRDGARSNGCCGGNETCRNSGSGGSEVWSTSVRSGGVRSPNIFVPRKNPSTPAATPPTTYQMTLLLPPPPDGPGGGGGQRLVVHWAWASPTTDETAKTAANSTRMSVVLVIGLGVPPSGKSSPPSRLILPLPQPHGKTVLRLGRLWN